jgi:hypothetical protein
MQRLSQSGRSSCALGRLQRRHPRRVQALRERPHFSSPSLTSWVCHLRARAETQTVPPHAGADPNARHFDLPPGAPTEGTFEARASPAVVTLPYAPVSLGMRGPTALSQPAGAELVKLTVQTPKLIIDDTTDPETIPVKTKAFVRDVLKVFALAQ